MVGNTLGGLHVLVNEYSDPLPEEPQIVLYPVPLEKNEPLKVRTDRLGYLQVISVLGQTITPYFIIPPNQETSIKLPALASGMYLVRMIFGTTTYTKRIVIAE